MIHSICGLASLSINNNTASVIISKIIIIPYMETTKSFWEEIKTFDEQYIRHRHHLMWYRRLVLMLLCCEMYFLLKAVKRLLELQATAFHLKWYNLEACYYFSYIASNYLFSISMHSNYYVQYTRCNIELTDCSRSNF